MNWINAFEIMCYFLTAMLLADLFVHRSWREIRLFCSAALAGFILELLAVRVTGIYHYSPLFYISIGFKPYQFPFFGGLMWGGLTVYGLRIAQKMGFEKIMTAFVTGWLIVSMDLLLDVAAIRLDGGFWVWDGREITLEINHHMFMSVIWVNFLGYLFETPAIVYLTLRAWDRNEGTAAAKAAQSIGIGLAGVAIVGAASGISLFLNSVTDEWFACAAFLILWTYLTARVVLRVLQTKGLFAMKPAENWPVAVFWSAMYLYCLAALWKLEIIQAVPLYGILGILLFLGTLALALSGRKTT